MQFFHYVEALLQGNLGTATSTGQPVFDDLIATFPATLELATVALVIGASLGFYLVCYVRVCWHSPLILSYAF